MLDNTFSSTFESKSNILANNANIKADTLTQRTADKVERHDPFAARTAEAYKTISSNVAQLADALKSSLNTTTQEELPPKLQNYEARYDPNSEMNKDAWFTAGELDDASMLHPKNIVNLALGLKKSLANTAGSIAASPMQSLYSDSTQSVNKDAYPINEKLKENERLKTQLNSTYKELQPKLAAGLLSQEEIDYSLGSLQQQIADTELTEQERSILNSKPEGLSFNHPNSYITNKEILDSGEAALAKSKEVPKVVDTMLGSNHFNDFAKQEMTADIQTEIEPAVADLNKAKDAIVNGDYLKGLELGIPALGKVVWNGAKKIVTDPKGSAQAISEEYFDIMMSKFGRLGIVGDVLESAAIATKMQSEAIEKFIAENGRLPSNEEFTKITAWSALGGVLDQLGDKFVSGSGKAIKSALDKPTKIGIDTIRASAINNTAEEAVELGKVALESTKQSLLKKGINQLGKVASGATSLAADGVVEGLTEGAQEVIDAYSSELKPVGDLSQAAQATALGTLVGGGMGPANAIVEPVAKAHVAAGKAVVQGVAAAGNRIVENAQPMTEERTKLEQVLTGSAEHDYDNKVNKAISEDTIDNYTDKTTDNYRPILAVEALARINEKEDTDYETKANNLEKASKIVQEFNVDTFKRENRAKALEAKTDITPEERIELRDLKAVQKKDTQYRNELINVYQRLNTKQSTNAELKENLAKAKDETDPIKKVELLKQVFGSNGGSDLTSIGSSLNKLREGAKLTPQATELLDNVDTYIEAQNTLSKVRNEVQATNPKIVHNDIINGNKSAGFIGISDRLKNITNGLQNNNTKFADKNLQGLIEFTDRHNDKLEAVQSLKRGEKIKIGGSIYYNNGSDGFNTMLSLMQAESDALNKSVQVARSMYSGMFDMNTPELNIKAKVKAEPTVQEKKELKPEQSVQQTASKVSVSQNEKNDTQDSLSLTDETQTKAIKDMSVEELQAESNRLEQTQEDRKRYDLINDRLDAIANEAEVQDKPVVEKNSENQLFTDKNLSAIKIDIPYIRADNTPGIQKNVSALKAWKDIIAEIALYEQIKDCVGGS